MVNKGSFSFVAMLVINPVVILFYQNCSMTPISHAQNTPPATVSRQIASEAKPELAKADSLCVETKKECPRKE
ncbi:hypothetical protein [Bdellovibrio sp. HCB274]|uniref:hypothetical protein n=1 Tax=Bdellovibrio sp. HCB274 TaxID=3394361 RepID=UPI0039B5CA89